MRNSTSGERWERTNPSMSDTIVCPSSSGFGIGGLPNGNKKDQPEEFDMKGGSGSTFVGLRLLLSSGCLTASFVLFRVQ